MAMAQGLLEDYGDDIEGLLENYEIRAWIGEGQYGPERERSTWWF